MRLALSYSAGVSSAPSSSPSACQPASLYLPLTGSGKIERATGPKPAKRASTCFSWEVASRCSCSMAFSVRMAATMSRAFPFSPLAIGTAEVGPGSAERGGGVTGGLSASAGASVGGTDRPAGVVDIRGSCGTGWSGRGSKRLGGCRDGFSRATYDFARRPLPCRAKVLPCRPAETRRANDPPVP